MWETLHFMIWHSIWVNIEQGSLWLKKQFTDIKKISKELWLLRECMESLYLGWFMFYSFGKQIKSLWVFLCKPIPLPAHPKLSCCIVVY